MDLTGTLQRIQEQYELAVRDNEQDEKTASELSELISRLRVENEKLRAAQADRAARHKEWEGQIAAAIASSQKKSDSRRGTTAKLRALQLANTDLQGKLEAARTENERLKAELDEIGPVEEEASVWEARVREMQGRLEEINRARCAQTDPEMARMFAELQEQLQAELDREQCEHSPIGLGVSVSDDGTEQSDDSATFVDFRAIADAKQRLATVLAAMEDVDTRSEGNDLLGASSDSDDIG